MAARATVLGLLIGLGALASGCVLGPTSLDGPINTILRVETSPSAIDVSADNWYAPQSHVFVCPEDPPPLPDPGAERIGWLPPDACHDFGTFDSTNGLSVSLPIAEMAGPSWEAFAAAPDWYLLILDERDGRVTSAIRSTFTAPTGVVAF